MKKISIPLEQQIVYLYTVNADISARRLAKKFGLGKTTILRVLKRNGIKARTRKDYSFIPWNKGLKGTFRHSPETRKKISERSKKMWAAKIFKEKMCKLKMGEIHPNWKGGNPDCANCGKTLSARGYKKCSSCYLKAQTGENNPNWRNGISFEPYGLAFNKRLKEQIRKRDNYTCQECGYTQEQLGYKLPVHHIDYDKTNNNPNNLLALCRSCNAKVNFGRKEWTKYFQRKSN